jgi:aminomethyltransferase
MDVSIFEADVAPMQVQGPRSKDLIRDLWATRWRPPLLLLRRGRGRRDPRGREPDRLDRRGRLRALPAGQQPGDDLFERVFQAGEPYGIRVIAPSEARRIEAGIFNYGSDIASRTRPCT